MGNLTKAVIEAEAANEVQSWLEYPGVRDEFRRQAEAWEQVEQQQCGIDHDAERAARQEQRPLGDGEFPLQFDVDGVPISVSTANLSPRWNPLAAFKLAADAMATVPRPGVSGDITHGLAPWSISSAFVLLGVLHDRAAIERGGRWQPIMEESDHWPTFAVRVLIEELLIDTSLTAADEAFDAGDIRSALSTVREELKAKGLLPAGDEKSEPGVDDSAYVRVSTLWRDRFKNYKSVVKFLDSNAEIRSRKPSKNRLEVHSGDWARYFHRVDERKFESLDVSAEAMSAAIDEVNRRKDEVNRRKQELPNKTGRRRHSQLPLQLPG